MGRRPTPGLKERILKAAEKEFTTRGFHGVSVREIARGAGTRVSNLYAHFGGKEEIFRVLMDGYEEVYFSADTPLARAFARFELPDSLEELGRAARAMVKRFAGYFRLIYVDVVEFRGRHIARLFRNMRERYEEFLGPRLRELQRQGVLGPADPVAALMTVTLAYFNYFTVEHVFGARRHFDMPDDRVLDEMSLLFRHGLLARGGSRR